MLIFAQTRSRQCGASARQMRRIIRQLRHHAARAGAAAAMLRRSTAAPVRYRRAIPTQMKKQACAKIAIILIPAPTMPGARVYFVRRRLSPAHVSPRKRLQRAGSMARGAAGFR